MVELWCISLAFCAWVDDVADASVHKVVERSKVVCPRRWRDETILNREKFFNLYTWGII